MRKVSFLYLGTVLTSQYETEEEQFYSEKVWAKTLSPGNAKNRATYRRMREGVEAEFDSQVTCGHFLLGKPHQVYISAYLWKSDQRVLKPIKALFQGGIMDFWDRQVNDGYIRRAGIAN